MTDITIEVTSNFIFFKLFQSKKILIGQHEKLNKIRFSDQGPREEKRNYWQLLY